MITSVSRSLAQMEGARTAARNRNPGPNPFKQQLSRSSDAATPGRAGSATGAMTLPESRQILATGSAARGAVADSVSKAASLMSGSVSATAAVVATADSRAPSGSVQPGTSQNTVDTMKALSAALQAAGIDPNSLGMVAHDDLAVYPGGSYVNRLITLRAGNHTENFMADLVSINPNVAVTEIKNLLKMA